jgi:ATP adenylyltransferase
MLTLGKVSKVEGFNIGMNQGEVAGAGIASHLHQHIVPRWRNDANFFPIIAQTKAMPVLLGQMQQTIAKSWVE